MNIAIIGASKDRNKFSNKAVRAYRERGYDVFPVNPNERIIEGIKCYSNVIEIPFDVEVASIYLPPEIGIKVIDDIARKGIKKVYLNPGSESEQILIKLKALKIEAVQRCSIRAIGANPNLL